MMQKKALLLIPACAILGGLVWTAIKVRMTPAPQAPTHAQSDPLVPLTPWETPVRQDEEEESVPPLPSMSFECPKDLQQIHAAMKPYEGPIDTCIPTSLKLPDLYASVIGMTASLDSIQQACGPIATDRIEYLGEGECDHRTVLYSGTDHEIRIEWADPVQKSFPRSIKVIGKAMDVAGVKAGVSLAELEGINQAPIELSGFGWDGSGGHRSFKGGKLAALDADGNVAIHYDPDWEIYKKNMDEAILGETSVFSNQAAVQKVKPSVESITVTIPDQTRRTFLKDLLLERIKALLGKGHEDPVTTLGTQKICKDMEVDNRLQEEGAKIIYRTCSYEKGEVTWEFSKPDPTLKNAYVFEHLSAFDTAHLELFAGLESVLQSPLKTLAGILRKEPLGTRLKLIESNDPHEITLAFDGEKLKAIGYLLNND